MLWELINTGSLTSWDWPVFILCMLALVVGPVAIWLVAPRRRGR
jgi:uncharacterized integral membrane protein